MLPLRDQLPTRIPPVVNYALIAINVGVFAVQALGAASGADVDAMTAPLALVPAQLVAHPLASLPSLFGHMFLHASLGHVAGNMLYLWIFGDNVEDALGHARYALFYVACGLAAALAQVAVSSDSTVPMVGASGAISGVLAAYMLLYPRSPITVLNPIPLLWLFWGFTLLLPAWFVVLEFFAVNLWSALHAPTGQGGVAFAAHVGGFVAGLALLPLMKRRAAVDHDVWDCLVRPRARGLR